MCNGHCWRAKSYLEESFSHTTEKNICYTTVVWHSFLLQQFYFPRWKTFMHTDTLETVTSKQRCDKSLPLPSASSCCAVLTLQTNSLWQISKLETQTNRSLLINQFMLLLLVFWRISQAHNQSVSWLHSICRLLTKQARPTAIDQ